MTRTLTRTLEPVIHTLNCTYDPGAVLVSFARQPGAFALESACDTNGYGRHTIIGCNPVHRLEAGCGHPRDVSNALHHLTQSHGLGLDQARENLPFVGGWVGYLGYEFGAATEGVLRSEPHTALRFALYDSAAILDHRTGQWTVCAVDLPESTRPAKQRIEELTDLMTSTTTTGDLKSKPHVQAWGPSPLATPPTASLRSPLTAPFQPNMGKTEYLAKVRQAQAYIRAGDIYQVNLTQRFTTRVNITPLELYLRLRRANPADYAAYLPWDDDAILSVSPELFLKRHANGRVITRPIKGTIARSGDPATDVQADVQADVQTNAQTDVRRAAQLLASEKDRAELNMIIDLLRNDLGRVCEFGSVRVLADRDVEVHPTVLHLVATIAGQLRSDVSNADLLRATFPGGSITGCPKIRAMQIIRELEPTPRGAYCGAIGMISLDGRLNLSIAIRTLAYESEACDAGTDESGACAAAGSETGTLHLYAGGAITADSDPEAEYQECLAKAEGMFRALGCSTRDLPGD